MPGSSKSTRLERLRYRQLICWKRQKKALELVKDDQIARQTVQVLGEAIPLGEQNIVKLEEVGYKLYDERQCNLVYELRYKSFCKGKNVQSLHLPPNKCNFEKPPQACKLPSTHLEARSRAPKLLTKDRKTKAGS